MSRTRCAVAAVVVVLGVVRGSGQAHADASPAVQARCQVEADGVATTWRELEAAVRSGDRAEVGGASQAVAGAIEAMVDGLTLLPRRDECEPRAARTTTAAERRAMRAAQRAWRRFEAHRLDRDLGGPRRLAALGAALTALGARCVAAADAP